MAGRGHEQIEHTSDVGLRVWAEDMAGLLAEATEGMLELMLDREGVAPRREREISAEGADDEALLVAWLEEVLFVFEVGKMALAAVEVDAAENGAAGGRLLGEDFDPGRHEVRSVIKAVTWHNLEVKKSDAGYEVTVILDV